MPINQTYGISVENTSSPDWYENKTNEDVDPTCIALLFVNGFIELTYDKRTKKLSAKSIEKIPKLTLENGFEPTTPGKIKIKQKTVCAPVPCSDYTKGQEITVGPVKPGQRLDGWLDPNLVLKRFATNKAWTGNKHFRYRVPAGGDNTMFIEIKIERAKIMGCCSELSDGTGSTNEKEITINISNQGTEVDILNLISNQIDSETPPDSECN